MQCLRCGKEWEGKGLLCPQCAASSKGTPGSAPLQVRSNEQSRSTTGSLNPSPKSARAQGSRPTSGSLPTSVSRPPAGPSLSAAAARAEQRNNDQMISPARPLSPGTLLQNGRYCLRVLQECQLWLHEAFEATWLAQDSLQPGSTVTIREVVVPEKSAEARIAIMRQATRAFLAVSAQPQLPTLKDTFSDQGRFFFVFERPEGESLLALLQARKHFLEEAEVIEMCLQLNKILEVLARQAPPLVHGLIDPRHILVSRVDHSYVLTNASILLAGQAAQWVTGTDRARLSPYMAPELASGTIDGRADLYSLLATASYLVRGSIPPRLQATHRLHPVVSTEFAALLFNGLHPLPTQRYQNTTELQQALLALSPQSKTQARNQPETANALPLEAFIRSASTRQQEELPAPTATSGEEAPHRLLPPPEKLTPMPAGHDLRAATLWLLSILIFLSVVIFLAKGTL